jgi:polyisoprenyl-phosphate glycosyltransferase
MGKADAAVTTAATAPTGTPAVSFVVPVYHNATTLHALHARLTTVADGGQVGDAEFVFVDDGSADDSFAVLQRLAAADPRVRVVKLSRNFGSASAITAGLAHARGDCAAVIAADLQDPPEVVARFVAEQRKGFDVVLGARSGRDDPLLTRLFAAVFYALFRRFALPAMPPQGFDCFLATRRVYRLLVETATPNAYLAGQLLWLGFPRSVVEYERVARGGGRSMWTFWRKVRYFIDSFVSFSYAPIRAASMLGLALAALGFLYALVIVGFRVVFGYPVEGWAALMVAVLLLGGAQLTVLGVLGEYLWRTLDANRRRPPFIVEQVVERPGAVAHLPEAPGTPEATRATRAPGTQEATAGVDYSPDGERAATL